MWPIRRFEMADLTPAQRRLLSLGGTLVLTLAIYWVNTATPSTVRLGLLYMVPVPLVNQGSYMVVCGIAMFAFHHMKRTQDALHLMATRDPLTRVLNGRAFTERVTHELERSRRYKRPLSLLYLDLDNFKVLNDSRGHQTGDAVLRLVADAMRQAVRLADVVGRLGGDEFAVLMPETDGALADLVAARLAANLRS